MVKENKFCVIGGQYNIIYYGARPTLIGAKRLANKCQEFWDNHQGWHTPKIYHIEDVEFNSEYNPNDIYSYEVRPKLSAVPIGE